MNEDDELKKPLEIDDDFNDPVDPLDLDDPLIAGIKGKDMEIEVDSLDLLAEEEDAPSLEDSFDDHDLI